MKGLWNLNYTDPILSGHPLLSGHYFRFLNVFVCAPEPSIKRTRTPTLGHFVARKLY